MMKLLKAIVALVFMAALVAGGFGYGRWYSTRPEGKATERKPVYYVDAMHPWYKSDKPGIAPDCGMKLVPVYADGTQGSADADAASAGTSADEQRQLIGVRYETAAFSAPQDSFRAVGRVTADETRMTRVMARTDGWIDSVAADFTGKYVAQGEPLLTFYSPELLASEQEFLLALKAARSMETSSLHDTGFNSHALVEASRRRLQLLKMTTGEIEEVGSSGTALNSITLLAPASGYIVERNAFPGQRITSETELYKLADLSHVWVIADVPEADAARVAPGQSARISFPGADARAVISAKVAYIQPRVDPATHTLKVRFDLAGMGDKPGFLKPDLYADVEFQTGGVRRLMVPAEAVLDAGTSKTVFVDAGDGRFEQRQVETGDHIGDRVEIVSGLKAGERYAASGVFLLNSESQMKAAAK